MVCGRVFFLRLLLLGPCLLIALSCFNLLRLIDDSVCIYTLLSIEV